MRVTFINKLYDQDGDCYDESILLIFDETNILKVKNTEDINLLIAELTKVVNEIDM